MKKMLLFAIFSSLMMTACASTEKNNSLNVTSSKSVYDLNFDSSKYTVESKTINGITIKYRSYENIVYVSNPVDTKYQILNFYVPEDYFSGKTINGFTKDSAPIFLPNGVGGYMPSEPIKVGVHPYTKESIIDSSFYALSKGFIVATPGLRGRVNKDESGTYTGKAPASIVDYKAAVRYLHFNDKAMPGDANKIISNGTSAGGALSVLLGATADNKDYEPYLNEIGAANASDKIFAVSAYCPITNLDHADMAYEWQFNNIFDYRKLQIDMETDYKISRMYFVEGTMNNKEIEVSKQLKQLFPSYVNSLNLKDKDGNSLSLDENGNGSFKEYYKSIIIASAQNALDKGTDISKYDWITIKNNKVVSIDFDKYVKHVGRMKVAPAFDGLSLEKPENDEFGTSNLAAQHFTDFSFKNSLAKGNIADTTLVKMMNPMSYIENSKNNLPKYWRIRHGEIDSDTSLAISAILVAKLQNKNYVVDYAAPWATPHSGDYDLEELFTWIKTITSK